MIALITAAGTTFGGLANLGEETSAIEDAPAWHAQIADSQVHTRIDDGTAMVPACETAGATADGQVAGCAMAEVIGDTHQYTFAGLLYDFQATGDFVEARVGDGFEVQTRKAAGGWNTSVNRSVATRMGTTRVAVCDTARLVVDGQTTILPPGGSLSLPTGVDIQRVDNTYLVSDQSGNSLGVTARGGNLAYVDVEIGLGAWPVTVRGLLGNPENDPHLLEARDGTWFTVPIGFFDLYYRFGASWRATPAESLLAPCNPVSAGNPSAPFFAAQLPPWLREPASNTCAMVNKDRSWDDPCILDVAVIGPSAVATYAGREEPMATGDDVPPPTSTPICPGPRPRPGPCR